MTLAELETVARLALPITVVVFDDAAPSLIELKQGAGQGGPEAVRYRRWTSPRWPPASGSRRRWPA
jgi:acetolactate synthase-1/2/3 large subunit